MPTINPFSINDPVVNMLREQIAEAALKPEPERAPFSLRRTQAYLWRSKPGTLRKAKIKIPGIPASVATIDTFHGIKEIRDYGAKFQKIFDRKHTPELRAMFEAAREANGGQDYISFTELSQTFECYYETDSEAIATFMRWYLDSHPKVGQYIYEDLGIQMLKSRYTTDEFPNTEAGRQRLFAHDRAFEKALAEYLASTPGNDGDEKVEADPMAERTQVLTNVPVPPVDVTQPIAEAVTPVKGSQAPKGTTKKG